jgi:hypothetical protein
MSNLALSAKLFAGSIIYVAVEAAGTSDISTRPASNSNLWLELAGVNSAVHKPVKVTELADVPDADTGWREEKDEYTLADVFEVKSRYTTALYEQLRYGLAGAIVQGTAQTPFIKADRKLRGWINVQHRNADGQDRTVLAFFAEIRAMDPPASEKKTQEPSFELRIVKSTLASVYWPS